MSVTADPTLATSVTIQGGDPLRDHGVIGATIGGHLASYSADIGPDTRVAVARYVDTSDGPDDAVTWWQVEIGASDGSSTITLTADDWPALARRIGALLAEAPRSDEVGG